MDRRDVACHLLSSWKVSTHNRAVSSCIQAISERLYDIPDVFCGVTELATGHTCTQAVVADTDSVILERIRKVVAALCHSTDEDADALFRRKISDIVAHSDNWSIETQRDLATVWRKVVGDWVLDDLEELLLRRC